MRWISVLLLLGLSSCESLTTGPSLKKEQPIPWRNLSTLQTVKITQDKSGVVVLQASEPVSTMEPKYKTVLVKVTGYCPCSRCCGRMTGKTATGGSAWGKGVAADLSWLSPGTVVEIPGYGQVTVDDTGGRMKRKYWRGGIPHADVRFKYHGTARNWGVQYLEIKVFVSPG